MVQNDNADAGRSERTFSILVRDTFGGSLIFSLLPVSMEESSLQHVGGICPRCGRGKLILDSARGEVFCVNCGEVLVERVEYAGPESRRLCGGGVGNPVSERIADRGISSLIGWDFDASGVPLRGSAKTAFERMRKADRRVWLRAVGESYNQALYYLDAVASKLSLSEHVKEEAGNILRKAVKGRLTVGRRPQEIVAACVYIACRESGVYVSMDDVGRASGVRKKDVGRAYRLLVRKLNRSVPMLDAKSLISKVASNAGLGDDVRREAVSLMDRAKGKAVGKNPFGLAAAAVYLVVRSRGLRIPLEEIAEAAGVTVVTVRNDIRRVWGITFDTRRRFPRKS